MRIPSSRPQIPMKKMTIMTTTDHSGMPIADQRNCQFRPLLR
jgi:hypothetical protein